MTHPLLTTALRAISSCQAAAGKAPICAVITGPTGSGKTALSINVALALAANGQPCEIINADSRQCYRGLDIGTAKVTPAEARGVKHHLLSVLDPRQAITIAWYQQVASIVIDDCFARGVLPLFVGGSMLYLSAVLDGFEPLPSDPLLRRQLEQRSAAEGADALHAELARLDPASAARTPPQNQVYVVRALEITLLTGQPASQAKRCATRRPSCVLVLEADRELLRTRIGLRTRQLLQGGWVEEVDALRHAGYLKTDPGLESHGYREILAELEAGRAPRVLHTDEHLANEIDRVTLAYTKRQRTWWKRDTGAITLPVRA